jgi:pilus assembly protein CpaC
MNKPLIYTIATLALILANTLSPAFSQEEQKDSRQIAIQAHHSKLMTFEAPITRASVADPKIADVKVLTPTQILVVAKTKTASSTTLILWLNDKTVKVVDVVVFTAIPHWVVSSVQTRIRECAPGVDVRISPTSTQPEEKRLLLSGKVPSMGVLNQVLTIVKSYQIKYYNLIQVSGPQQVQLKVVIAEVSKSGLKQMGLSFFRISDQFGASLANGGDATIGNQLTGGVNQGTTTNEVILSTALTSPFGSAFNLAVASTKHNLGGILSLLKNQGLARTLATPTLVTMNGQKAQFHVGGSYPIPVTGENGQVTIEDKEYGIILQFTPYILGNDTITLEVSPEVSAPDYSLAVTSGGTTVPGLTKRKANTTLQLKPGQTFAMAGLLKEEFYQTVDKVPFLGDIPYIGSFFTSKEVKHSETELMIMVTPTIVQPMNPDQVPNALGSGMQTQISDTDFFIKNRLSKQTPTKQAKENQAPISGFKGQTGFAK